MDRVVSGNGVETAEYQQETGTVRTQFDQTKTPASTAIIATLAEVLDADPMELDPLISTVDPDAIDALFRVRNEMTGDIHVSLTHEGHSITAHSYGVITITPGNESTAEQTIGTQENEF